MLRPSLAADRFGLVRVASSGPLAPFVDYYWIVRWDLRGQPSHEQTILPHPAEQVADLVTLITSAAWLRRVDQLAVVSGLPARRLQRLFSDYVGVSWA
jgi:hypothetical protein